MEAARPRNCPTRPPQMNSRRVFEQQLGHRLGVPGGVCVLDRLLHQTVLSAPRARAPAQHRRGLAPELQPQKLAEQMVIAVPLPAACSATNKNTFACASSDSAAAECSRPSTTSHSSGVKTPSTDVWTKSPGSPAGAPSELRLSDSRRRAESCRRTPVPRRRGPRGYAATAPPSTPAGHHLGALDEQLDALARQLDPLTLDQLTCFVDAESQLADANLRQRPSHPQARKTDRRVRARRRSACWQADARSRARSSEATARSRRRGGHRARSLPDDRT